MRMQARMKSVYHFGHSLRRRAGNQFSLVEVPFAGATLRSAFFTFSPGVKGEFWKNDQIATLMRCIPDHADELPEGGGFVAYY